MVDPSLSDEEKVFVERQDGMYDAKDRKDTPLHTVRELCNSPGVKILPRYSLRSINP